MLQTKSCLLIRTLAFQQQVRFHSVKVAVVGSGPAGFYTTQKLLHHPDVKVDIYEKLPVPFGLVRYGVAPDHADVKNVVKSFTSIASDNRVNFYGNIALGKDLNIDDLLRNYHAVVLSYGSAQDRLLEIEGENSKNTISARTFVGWYNGLPEDKSLDVDLNCDTACIIGQGNVAIDCARILLKRENLKNTDITSYAQDRIAKSNIRRIFIIGRRGPVQVSFTSKELRELINLNPNHTRIEPKDIFQSMELSLKQLKKLPRTRRRLTEIMLNASTMTQKDLTTDTNATECVFKFLSRPIKIVADPNTNQVKQLELAMNQFSSLEAFIDQNAKPDELDDTETIDCGLIIRSVGYKSVMLDNNLPVNHKEGSILNSEGRVHGYKNLYCSGWLATGASGVIAGTLSSSQVTAQSILDDLKSHKIPNLHIDKLGYDNFRSLLRSKGVQVIHFDDWVRIDELERRLGEELGKPREKYVDIDQMLDVARENKD